MTLDPFADLHLQRRDIQAMNRRQDRIPFTGRRHDQQLIVLFDRRDADVGPGLPARAGGGGRTVPGRAADGIAGCSSGGR